MERAFGGKLILKTSKRLLDLLISVPLLIGTAPILGIIALAIRIDSQGPILFRQVRIGSNRREFTILKFRTMKHRTKIDQQSEAVIKEGHDPRITRVGRILRKTSLDELPQLVNIIRGDMSLVGPRPVIPEQLRAIPPRYLGRFSMPPGITGLAQVKGRRSLNWIDQLKYDVEYCTNWRFLGDIKLMFQTVWVVLTGSGVYGSQEDNWRNYIDKSV